MSMQIDMAPILAGEVKSIQFDYTFGFEDKDILANVVFPELFTVKGAVTNNAGYMKLTASATVPYKSVCARCMRDIAGVLPIDFEKNVAVISTLQNEDTDDYLFIEDAKLDLYEPLCEQIILEFPTKLLCKEDCKGLCPKCGKDLNEGDCTCPTKEIDPRLAIIQKYIDQLED